MSSAVVVGGGISGLAAARLLARAGFAVTVCEAGPRFGGKLATLDLDGVRLDAGAESVLARRPEGLRLIVELGLDDRRVHPTTARPALLIEGVPRALPPTVGGVPTQLEPLQTVCSPKGYARAAAEEPLAPLTDDVAIGVAVDRALGAEVTDRVLEPMLGGVYAGHARRLSFAAVAPDLYARARSGGSLLEHARATLRPGAGPVFAGLVGGVSTLVDALVADLQGLGVELQTNATVRELARTATGYRLTSGPVPAPRKLIADAVILAVPAAPAARLLAGLSSAATALGEIPYASTALVTFALIDVEPVGSGLLVPPGQLPSVKALTHSSRKWDWVAQAAADRWGAGVHVVRASVGRAGEESLLQLDDEALAARTLAELRTLPGWGSVRPLATAVTRWGGGLPQYRVGHRTVVETLRAELAVRPGLAVAGALYEGVGIAACLGSAETSAAKVVADLGGAGRDMIDR